MTLVVDDHVVVREGIKAMLATDSEIEVVGEAGNGAEAVQKAGDLKPQVVLMDVRMPEIDGIEATRRIKAAYPDTAVVMLTMYDHDVYVIEAVRAGATGYILKDASRELLLHTVKAARSGGSLIKSTLLLTALGGPAPERNRSPELDQPVQVGDVEEGAKPEEHGLPPIPNHKGLTNREMEVLELLTQGKTNKEIGQVLWITELTVKKHVASIIAKLHASNRSDAAVRAVRGGLLRRSP
jgi:DNA-binding NarL/FixJ family response regulator